MAIDRRSFLLGASALALLCLSDVAQAAWGGRVQRVQVVEVTMATPDIVCVELRDPQVRLGYLVDNGSTIAGTPHAWMQRNNSITGETNQWGMIVGTNSDYFRYGDKGPTVVLNRDAVKNAAGYGQIGGKTVTAVYFRSMMYKSGKSQSGTAVGSNKHFVFLKLSANLTQGSHTITFPSDAGIAPVSFTFNDLTTRAIGIRYTQAGQQASDTGKLGYFGLWIPGAPNEGAVELATTYSLTAFDIIDAAGTVVHSGTMTQRASPTSNEAQQSGNGLQYYASTNIAPLQATSVTPSAATTQIGFGSAHGLTDGDRVFCRGFSNDGGRISGVAKVVTVVDPNTITVPNSPASTWTYTADTYLPGFDSLVYKTFQANRAATYVYNIDFSAWTSGNGTYRIRIPGLGVSDPFKIGADAWLDVAKVLAAGEYNNRFGINADARFNYQRPPQCQSQSGTILWSTLPAAFANEAQLIGQGSAIIACLGGVSPYITASSVNAWGAHHTAGDNDSFANNQCSVPWMLVDAYEIVPPGTGNLDLNIPKSSQVRDPAIWPASTDTIPDLIQSAIWWCDFYRQTQLTSPSAANGVVAGGCAPYGTSNTSSASLGWDFEPSWIASTVPFLFAGDPVSNFGYAAAAAKLGKALNDLGFTTQGALFINSAELAYDWAETIWNDTPNTAGPADNYFIGYLDFLTKSGWSTSTYATNFATMKTNGANQRIFAACALQRATGNIAKYSSVANTVGTSLAGFLLYGGWDFINTAGADSTIKTNLTNSLTSLSGNTLIYCESSSASYLSIGNNNQSVGIFGQNGADFSTFGLRLLYGHKLSGNSRFITALQKCFGLVLGANQYGMSFLTGCGVRNPGDQLQQDAYNAGWEAPMGTTTYAWAGSSGGTQANNFGSTSASYIIENLQFGQLSAGQPGRLMEPWRFAIPMWDAVYENFYVISCMEFAIVQTTIPQLLCAIYLNGWNK